MEGYLKSTHCEEVTDLLNDSDDTLHVSILLNLSHLYTHNRQLFDKLIKNPHEEWLLWNKSLVEVQKQVVESNNVFLEDGYQIKENCYVRFFNMPNLYGRSDIVFPGIESLGKFVQIKGNIVRMTQTRLVEIRRDYVCSKCKQTFTIEAEYCKMYNINPPKYCPNGNRTVNSCKGILHPESVQPKPENCIDYQEFRLQELFTDKNVPSSMVVTIENDLSDLCQPGDCVTVCGTIERRWKPLVPLKVCDLTITMRAVSIHRDDSKSAIGRDLPEHLICVRAQWQDTIEKCGELKSRDAILKSICPSVHGMYLVKLAVALSMASGVEGHRTKQKMRTHSHLLMVGDPGMAKSQLIKFAAKVAVRSVCTTGMGCSQAGLTAAAVQDSGDWQLEAGALVLADGGICCVDEFNLMRESDRASIHEAMEQQTVSMAKAGMVCKLMSRCAVLAATNHKNVKSMSRFDGNHLIDIGMASPLLSRFDLVLILRDTQDTAWDEQVTDHVLGLTELNSNHEEKSGEIWPLEKLQSHFLAIRNVHPEMSTRANEVLGHYYKFCRLDPMRDKGRTTGRLLDSLIRLAQSHARLVFRSTVTLIDAITVIMLVESSWGFGRLIPPLDVIKTQLPLGPTDEDILNILKLLHVDFDPDSIKEELRTTPSEKTITKIALPVASQELPDTSGSQLKSTVQSELDCSFISLLNRKKTSSNKNQSKPPSPIASTSYRSVEPSINNHGPCQPTRLKNIFFNDILEETDNLDDILNLDFKLPSVQRAKSTLKLHNQIFTPTQETQNPSVDEIPCRRGIGVEQEEIPLSKEPEKTPPPISKTTKFKRKVKVSNENDGNLNNFGNEFGFVERKKIRKSKNVPESVVPQEDLMNIDHLLCGIQESFSDGPVCSPHRPQSIVDILQSPVIVSETQESKKSLQLSTTQDIDLDEIFGNDDDDGDVTSVPAVRDIQIPGPSTRLQENLVIEKLPIKVSTQTIKKLNMFRYEPGVSTTTTIITTTENPQHSSGACLLDKVQVNTNDSSETPPAIITTQNLKSFVLGAEEDEDLDCLNFDL